MHWGSEFGLSEILLNLWDPLSAGMRNAGAMDSSRSLAKGAAGASPPAADPVAAPQGPSEKLLCALVSAVAEGDSDALDRLYDTTSGGVLELSQRILGESLEAEEVVLDIFARVWSRAKDFDSKRGNVRAWLMIMTRSRALDVVRSLRARRQREVAFPWSSDSEAPAAEATAGPMQGLLGQERSDLLTEALATLSPNQRAAIERTFFDGLSHERVAHALGQPLGTIKGQIRRGLRRLRQALERHGTEQ